MRVIFYHGLEGTPLGSKPTALREILPQLEAPDFQGMKLEDRVRLASEDIAAGGKPVYLIGSSLGGLMAAIMADRHPDLVKGYLLCAPALHWHAATELTEAPKITDMILGKNDSKTLNLASSQFAAKFGIPVMMVDDGHRLENSITMIKVLAQAGYTLAMQA